MNILEKYGLGDYAEVYPSAIEISTHAKTDEGFVDSNFLLVELEKRIRKAALKDGIELAIRTIKEMPELEYETDAGALEYAIMRTLRMLLEKG